MLEFVGIILSVAAETLSAMIVFVLGGLFLSALIAYGISIFSKKAKEELLNDDKTPPKHSTVKKEIVLESFCKFFEDGYLTLWVICLIIIAILYTAFEQLIKGQAVGMLITVCFSIVFPVAIAVNGYAEAIVSIIASAVYVLVDSAKFLTQEQSTILFIFIFSVLLLLFILSLIKQYKKNSIRKVRDDLYFWVPINGLIKRDGYEIIHELEKRISSYQECNYRIDAIEYVNLEGFEIERWSKKGLDRIRKILFISDMILLGCLLMNHKPFQQICFGICLFIWLFLKAHKGNADVVWERLVIRLMFSKWGFHIKHKSEEKFVGNGMFPGLDKARKRVNLLFDIIAIIRILAFKDKYENTSLLELAYTTIIRGNQESKEYELGWYLPLLVLSMFYYWCNDSLNDHIKADLSKVLQEHRYESLIFMQSLWCYLWCKEVEKEGGDFAKQIAELVD